MLYFEERGSMSEKFRNRKVKETRLDPLNELNLTHLRKELFKKNIGEYDTLDIDKYERDNSSGEEEEGGEEGGEGGNLLESQYSIPNLPYYLTDLGKE